MLGIALGRALGFAGLSSSNLARFYSGLGPAAGIEPGRYYLKKQLFLVFFL